MMNILALLQCIQPEITKTNLKHLSRIVEAMLSINGRVTMLSLSRWAGKGGSYRTIQRFFNTSIAWEKLNKAIFERHLYHPEKEYFLVGDECVATKSGHKTYGLDIFFSGLLSRVTKSIAIFTLSLVDVNQRRAYPMSVKQVVRSQAEKEAARAKKKGPHKKYGDKIEYRHIPQKYRVNTHIDGHIKTCIYQAQMLHRDFAQALNVVFITKTNLKTGAVANVNLFSSDLSVSYEKIIDYYRLRFQIEFNFRDAKQVWGLEDFMNVNQVPLTNALNLSLFMVNVSQVLLHQFRQTRPESGILDLKAYFRAEKYVDATIKLLPEKPEPILLNQIFAHVSSLGCIHSVNVLCSSP